MFPWVCLCQTQDEGDVNINSRHKKNKSESPTSSTYAKFHDEKQAFDSFRYDGSMGRPHFETVDSPTTIEYSQHMKSSTLASELQEILSQQAGLATSKPVFFKVKHRKTDKSRGIPRSMPQSPARNESSRRIGSLYRSQSSPDLPEIEVQPLVKIRVPPGPTGLVLQPNVSGPVVVDGFEPIFNPVTDDEEQGVIEKSEEVGPGSILVSIENVSVLDMSYSEVVAMLEACEAVPRELVFQTYAAD
ncbi:hypothetical protein AC1031_016152 [Aphanomyces cochlioides]|nr:hypothetical protein AC1031_016152 [Aphanomyces cochlioides]